MEVKHSDVVLCEFYFSDLKKSKKRPVLVFKDNLLHDDFVAIPISSKIEKMYEDEFLINHDSFEEGKIPRESKLMVRKTFIVSKQSIVKKYGTLNKTSFKKYHAVFCKYFGCKNEEK